MSWIYDGKTYAKATDAAITLAREHGCEALQYDIWRERFLVYDAKGGLITSRKFEKRADGARVIAPESTTTKGKT